MTRLLLILLSALLAISFPLRYVVVWYVPEEGAALGLPILQNLPRATLILIAIVIPLQSIVFFRAIQLVWKVVAFFRSGSFFAPEVAVLLRTISWLLIGMSLLGTGGFVLGVLSIWNAGRTVKFPGLYIQAFNLPLGILVCGLFGLVIAGAFARASKMAQEARYTV